jgi:chromosome segregation ATPase
MGLIQNLVGRKTTEESASASPPAGGSTVPDGRGRLRTAAAELAKAKECITDLEARLGRLNTIISDADTAHAALQAAIKEDGGVALEAYGAGRASNQPIAKLVETKENTAKAASAARDALPNVQDMLASGRAQEAALVTARFDAVIVYLKMRASDEHKTYMRAFKDLCDSYDALCGIANALSATGHSEMLPRAFL